MNKNMFRKLMIVWIVILFIGVSLPIIPGSHKIPTNHNTAAVENNIQSNFNGPEILWWYNLTAPSFGSAAVGDIDKDGSLEIVFGTYFNDEHIYALNAENGSLLWKYNTGGCNDASPVIADVDLDGDVEVVVPASSPYRVYCFNGTTGAVEWSRSTGYPNCIDSPPAVADVDNDDKPEVLFGTFYGYVFCLNGEDGSIRWQINLGTNSYIQSEPSILDCDEDGKLDVVVAQFAGDCRVYALNGENGSTLWYSDQPSDYMYHGGSFADVDEDGKNEIIIGCYDSNVYVMNCEDGSPVWDYNAPFYIGAPTSLADLNNDGHLEIVFASYDTLGVLTHTGGLLWNYPTGGSIFRGAAIADVNGDGMLDVGFGSADGILRALRGDNGQVVWTYNLQAHYGRTFDIDHAPVIADFNNDGKLDIFVVGGYGTSSNPTLNHGRAYALTAGQGMGAGWPMFRHDIRHSGCFSRVNTNPYEPNTPFPQNGATDVDAEQAITLSWMGGDPDVADTVTYDVYFGTTSPPPKRVSNQSVTTYDPGVMNYTTRYYWMIVAWDNHGASTTGALWDFTTQQKILCGDANGDGFIDISDAVFLIQYIFAGGPAPNPLCSGDANGDSTVDISDAVYLITYIFGGGPAPVSGCCG